MITDAEYDELMPFMEEHILNLWRHEVSFGRPQEQTQTGFSIRDCFKFEKDEHNCFFVVFNSTFLKVICRILPHAVLETPEKFGTGNPIDVIEAIYHFSGFEHLISREEYFEHLIDQPCYIVYKHNGIFDDDILRIDLFRGLCNNGSEFQGGLFHVLKHYSQNGVNLSIGAEINNNVRDIRFLISKIGDAFGSKFQEQDSNDYVSIQEIGDGEHCFKHVFYREQESGVFFLRTSHMQHL